MAVVQELVSIPSLRETGVTRDWSPILQPLLLIAFAIGIYFTRIAMPNLRGEEPTRARVAIEMIRSGDLPTPQDFDNVTVGGYFCFDDPNPRPVRMNSMTKDRRGPDVAQPHAGSHGNRRYRPPFRTAS
jgi:hypothetical protein